MERFEVRLLLSDHRGKRHWRKRLKAPDPIAAGEEAMRRCQSSFVVLTHILRGSVLGKGGLSPLALWPYVERVGAAEDEFAEYKPARWVLTTELTSEQLAEWHESGAIN